MKEKELPQDFLDKMERLLGDSCGEYVKSLENRPFYGLRFNPLKLTPGEKNQEEEALLKKLSISLKPVLWEEDGYYYEEALRPARHPYYYAGLYYLQEPSAMTPAALLPVSPGDRVLDLCAAPGGKSTKLVASLKGEGLLFSNDISNSRAKALLKNLELFGATNILVASEAPEKLAKLLPDFFDKILVDAPCSGEGMFRRDPEMVKSYRERGPEYYRPLQREILNQAVRMLRPGGLLLYSTCTFDEEENEGNIRFILDQYQELSLVDLHKGREALFARCGFRPGLGLPQCVRLFPHLVQGEGHFAALLQKNPSSMALDEKERFPARAYSANEGILQRGADLPEDAKRFFSLIRGPLGEQLCPEKGRLYLKNNSLYLLPEAMLPHASRLLSSIRYLRTGLLLGELKKNRFEPSQALAMALSKEGFSAVMDFPLEDERVLRYLKGETVTVSPRESAEIWQSGWRLVCVDSYPLGFAKAAAGSLKNKYAPGWRWQ